MDSAKYWDVGGRETNEDYVVNLEIGDNGFYLAADGLGGHNCGEVASKCVCETMMQMFEEKLQNDRETMREYFVKAQQALLKKAEEEPIRKGMRTTAVALAICGKIAAWGHVGDSRLYHIRDGEVLSITADHSVAYISYLNGEIKYKDIRKSPDQNRLIRSMGSEEKFKPDIAESVEVKDGDAFLLCTDGFWEYISEKEITASLKKSRTASRWLAKMVRVVKKNGRKNPDRDNSSAVTVLV